jgi:hypothetical protein
VTACLWAGWTVLAFGQGGQYVRESTTLVENVDYYHEVISRRVIGAVSNLDEFFADDRLLEETNETQVRLSSAVRYEDGKSLTMKLSLKGRIVLPHLEERFLIFVDTDGRERDIKDQLSQVDTVSEDDKSLFTASVTARARPGSRVSVTAVYAGGAGPVPFCSSRARNFTYVIGYPPDSALFCFSDVIRQRRRWISFANWLPPTIRRFALAKVGNHGHALRQISALSFGL